MIFQGERTNIRGMENYIKKVRKKKRLNTYNVYQNEKRKEMRKQRLQIRDEVRESQTGRLLTV